MYHSDLSNVMAAMAAGPPVILLFCYFYHDRIHGNKTGH